MTASTGGSAAPEHVARLTVSEVARKLLERPQSATESSVSIGTTAKHGSAADPEPKRLHTWEITVRGEDVSECARVAQRLDDGLAAKYAHELDTADTLADQLARSVKP